MTRVVDLGGCLLIGVELLAPAGCCRWCGRSSLTVKERPVVRVRDLPIAGRATYLVWRKRRFGCEACGRTFTEAHPALLSRQRVSARFRARLFERCRGGGAHAEVAREEQTTRYQVMRAFWAGADEFEAARDRPPPRRLSLDEAAHRRRHELATVVSDLDRRCVVEVLDGRNRRTVQRWLRALPDQHRHAIEVVSIDPYEAYRQAIMTELPWARIVVDHFHPHARRAHRSSREFAATSKALAEAVASALGDVLRGDHLLLEHYDARYGRLDTRWLRRADP